MNVIATAAPDATSLIQRVVRLESTDPRWIRFVLSHGSSLIFHHPAWLEVIARSYGYRPFALGVLDDSEAVIAGLPILEVGGRLTGRRWLSLPFTDYIPPLAAEPQINGLVTQLHGQMLEHNVRTFRLHADLPASQQVSTSVEAVRHTLPLTRNATDVYSSFSKMHRRNIAKALKAGVEVRRSNSPAALWTFYRLHVATRRRLGVPVQPKRFFALLGRGLIGPGLGSVLTAYVDGVPAAAAVFLHWNGVLIYKYGASDQDYWEHRPNNLLFWTAIQWASENGYETFDWGRTDLEDQGLRDFKRGWGATEVPLTYSVIGCSAPEATSGRLRHAMETVIRHSPPWVCRALGELFYRYAA